MITWKGQTFSLETLAARVESAVLPGQPVLLPSGPSTNTGGEKSRNAVDGRSVVGGSSVVNLLVAAPCHHQVVHAVPTARSTDPTAQEPTGAGCPECCMGWADEKPGNACPSCGGLLLGSDLAYAIGEMRGYL